MNSLPQPLYAPQDKLKYLSFVVDIDRTKLFPVLPPPLRRFLNLSRSRHILPYHPTA